MPKAKPDRVEVIRIELQESERQILRDFVTSQSLGEIGQLADGIDKLLSFQNLYVAATIYEIITGKEVLIGTPNDLADLLGMVKDFFAANPNAVGSPFVGSAGITPIEGTPDQIGGLAFIQQALSALFNQGGGLPGY
ncbi:MAG: hypothetical protein [Bacteriophage sp.]|nr:MAG: hypothetical protein [Bacteriophage sp.]|tara:strand:+ start:1766 stop:2176 length:411 start_codon:yes stop_codon:yes gene_type:complete